MPQNDDQPLDMRFNTAIDSTYPTAADLLNSASPFELGQIFRVFGEERFSSVLAKKVVEARQGTILGTTGDFRRIVKEAFPQSSQSEKTKVVRRAFQAIRIAVNQELLSLQQFMEDCPTQIMDTKKSRAEVKEDQPSLLMVITFHSLEEKMVSQSFAKWKKMQLGDYGTKKPIEPSAEELEQNSKSHSAKLFSFLFN